jgi:hypothetical protein
MAGGDEISQYSPTIDFFGLSGGLVRGNRRSMGRTGSPEASGCSRQCGYCRNQSDDVF